MSKNLLLFTKNHRSPELNIVRHINHGIKFHVLSPPFDDMHMVRAKINEVLGAMPTEEEILYVVAGESDLFDLRVGDFDFDWKTFSGPIPENIPVDLPNSGTSLTPRLKRKSNPKSTRAKQAEINTPQSEIIRNGEGIQFSGEVNTGKNLIYYTINSSKDYLALLEKSINSILKNSPNIKCDFLIIGPRNVTSGFSFKSDGHEFFYFDVEDTDDAVSASMNKIRIYKWPRIMEYENILFLDADIICFGDFSSIFDKNINARKLNTYCNPKVSTSSHKSVYHSLRNYSSEQIEKLTSKDIVPFNAGQFIIKNSDYMKSHFENLETLIKSWSGTYFYEQSFMNYYFNLLDMNDPSALSHFVQFIDSVNEEDEQIKSPLIHFIGPAGDGVKKLRAISRREK